MSDSNPEGQNQNPTLVIREGEKALEALAGTINTLATPNQAAFRKLRDLTIQLNALRLKQLHYTEAGNLAMIETLKVEIVPVEAAYNALLEVYGPLAEAVETLSDDYETTRQTLDGIYQVHSKHN